MRLRFRLNLPYLVLTVIALLSFGAIVLKQSDQYLQVSAAVQSIAFANGASQERGPQAPGSIVSIFGNNLAPRTVRLQSKPPTAKLGGVTVQVTDSAGVIFDALLFYVDSTQINFLMPKNVALGEAQVVIKNGAVIVGTGKLKIVASAPGLFTKNSDKGKLVAGVTTSNDDGFQGTVSSNGDPRMISLGAPWNPTTLTLFATGLGNNVQDVRVRIGKDEVPSTSVSEEEGAFGVSRIQLKLPPTLSRGMTNVSLVVNSQSSAAPSARQAGSATPSSATAESSNMAQLLVQPAALLSPTTLSADDVKTIIAQAVAKAQQMGVAATIAVLDKEANVLGVFKMNGARADVLLGRTDLLTGQPTRPFDVDGLEQVRLPLAPGLGILSDGAALAAISKAGTGAFLSTQGSSISTRTASFIIGENFPRGFSSQPSGPLFGVQFSSLPCSDFRGNVGLARLPLGLAGDAGGFGIYKNGVAVGGVGIEVDGFYSVDINVIDFEQSKEEMIAVAAIKGYRPPQEIRADRILVDGMRLAFSNVPLSAEDGPQAASYDSLVGSVGSEIVPPSGQLVSRYTPLTLGGVDGRIIVDPNPGNPSNVGRQGYFPFKSSQVSSLSAADTTLILTQAAQQAFRTRAAIRIPLGSPAQVNITVVDTSGAVLGVFSTGDAPEFGFDVSAQKARTAVFFSLPNTGAQLRAANANTLNLDIGKYADAAAAFGVPLDGSFAFTSRSVGFLARPFYPDGIPNTPNGPYSKPLNAWSEFNDGLQIAAVKPALVRILTGGAPANMGCSPLPNDLTLANGIQIFAGSAPLFKNGVLVGAIGISGDGIDQDDIIAAVGSVGFEAPAAVRADQLTPLGVRLPYLKFPRSPNLRNPRPTVPTFRGPRPAGNVN